MITNIPFNRTYESLSEIEGVDVGNCNIEGMDPNENLYYLIIKTIRGTSYIVTCGPIGDSINIDISLHSIRFNEKKLKKVISNWLNDYTKAIYEAKLVEFEEALNNFPSIPERLLNLINNEQ